MNANTKSQLSTQQLETAPATSKASDYEAPAIEDVITLDELGVEFHFAGLPVGISP